MLARYMLSSCVCLHVSVSVCPSVRMSETSRYCFETTGRIQLVFAIEASFHLSYTVLQGNSGIYVYPKTRVFFPESAFRKFRHGKSIVLSAKLMTFELVDHTYDGLLYMRRGCARRGYYYSYYFDRNVRFVVDLSYSLFLHLCCQQSTRFRPTWVSRVAELR